jgi:hypothetical protein
MIPSDKTLARKVSHQSELHYRNHRNQWLFPHRFLRLSSAIAQAAGLPAPVEL